MGRTAIAPMDLNAGGKGWPILEAVECRSCISSECPSDAPAGQFLPYDPIEVVHAVWMLERLVGKGTQVCGCSLVPECTDGTGCRGEDTGRGIALLVLDHRYEAIWCETARLSTFYVRKHQLSSAAPRSIACCISSGDAMTLPWIGSAVTKECSTVLGPEVWVHETPVVQALPVMAPSEGYAPPFAVELEHGQLQLNGCSLFSSYCLPHVPRVGCFAFACLRCLYGCPHCLCRKRPCRPWLHARVECRDVSSAVWTAR